MKDPHLVDREIAKFRRGEQAALVSFANVAKLARNASRDSRRSACERTSPRFPTGASAGSQAEGVAAQRLPFSPGS